MTKKESVILALEHCSDFSRCRDADGPCPYIASDSTVIDACRDVLLDALSLLKPRLVAPSDFDEADDVGCIPAWAEEKRASSIAKRSKRTRSTSAMCGIGH